VPAFRKLDAVAVLTARLLPAPHVGSAGSSLISLQVELILQRAGDMSGGYELQRTDAKGEGVFATRSFQVGHPDAKRTITKPASH